MLISCELSNPLFTALARCLGSQLSIDGYRVALEDDVHMELSNRLMYKLVRDSQPGAWLVDLIPISERMVFLFAIS